MKGYMYILECSDGSYYTGSTKDIELRLLQHQNGEGSNHTRKRLPVKLLYFEEFMRIDSAFIREKQVQGWSRKKKEALINNMTDELHELAKCLNETSHVHFDSAAFDSAAFDSAQAPGHTTDPEHRSLSEAEGYRNHEPDVAKNITTPKKAIV